MIPTLNFSNETISIKKILLNKIKIGIQNLNTKKKKVLFPQKKKGSCYPSFMVVLEEYFYKNSGNVGHILWLYIDVHTNNCN